MLTNAQASAVIFVLSMLLGGSSVHLGKRGYVPLGVVYGVATLLLIGVSVYFGVAA